MRRIIGIMLAAALLIAQSRRQQDVDLQAAIRTETVNGDLKGAIDRYKRIAQGSDRALAAKALVRMADCYLKLGQGEAETTYRRVVRDYADQAESVAEARKRLSVLQYASPSDTIAKRRLWADCSESDASITSDGRWMALADWCDSGDLAVRDMVSGQVKRLMAKPNSKKDSKTYAWSPMFSPDMRQIAYLWEDSDRKSFSVQLRIMPNEVGGKFRVLIDKPEYTWYQPAGWSRDGKAILAILQKPDRTWQLAWISVDDGTVKNLKSLGWRLYNTDARPRLSPDGKYIAYNALPVNPERLPPESTEQRIYVLASDGSSETEVVKMAGINDNPIWTPDGKHLLFTSDRSGAISLWSIGMRDGKAVSPPTPVLSDVGKITAWGMTDSGTYHYSRGGVRGDEISVMNWQYDRTTPGGEAVVKNADLVGIRPSWSPDGKSLAFTRRRPSVKDQYDLVIHSLETGDETMYPFEGITPRPPEWFQDGKALLVLVLNAGRKPELYRVDLATKSRRKIFEFDPPVRAIGRFQIASDDNTLYVAVPSDGLNVPDRIYSLNIATKELKLILQTLTTTSQPLMFRLGPDGRTIAVRRRDPRDDKTYFSRVSIDGTDYRELYAKKGRNSEALAWTSDGRDILFEDTETELSWRVMRISSEGGEPVYTGMAGKGILQTINVSPVSSRLALFTSTDVVEYWSIDNLVPFLK